MPSSTLPPIRRIVIGHDSDAKAIIKYDTGFHGELLPGGVESKVLWKSDAIPADSNITGDPSETPTGFMAKGSTLRVVDIPPRSKGGMHRTPSLDYCVLIKGQLVHNTDDDASTTTVNVGDVVVQQGTMHQWNNETDEWARIVAVLLPATEPIVNGKQLNPDASSIGH
jgi:quercetin dioxygenase-like cupin family protein